MRDTEAELAIFCNQARSQMEGLDPTTKPQTYSLQDTQEPGPSKSCQRDQRVFIQELIGTNAVPQPNIRWSSGVLWRRWRKDWRRH